VEGAKERPLACTSRPLQEDGRESARRRRRHDTAAEAWSPSSLEGIEHAMSGRAHAGR
jgi:hypothetical protein